MTKTQFIQNLSDRTDLPRVQIQQILSELVTFAEDTLKEGEPFVIPGLVKITVKDKPAQPERQGRNPFTKEAITIPAKPASKKVVAKPVSDLKKALSE